MKPERSLFWKVVFGNMFFVFKRLRYLFCPINFIAFHFSGNRDQKRKKKSILQTNDGNVQNWNILMRRCTRTSSFWLNCTFVSVSISSDQFNWMQYPASLEKIAWIRCPYIPFKFICTVLLWKSTPLQYLEQYAQNKLKCI